MSIPAATVSVLAILPAWEDRAGLAQIFGHSHWNLYFVDALGRAATLVDELAVGVVITDCKLPDARWQDVLRELQGRRVEPPLIVASRLANDGLWAEVLNLGGYDVLAMPFHAPEVTRSVSLAWRRWRDKLVATDSLAGKLAVAGSGQRNL